MCGIAGIYVYRDGAAPVDEVELIRIREAMASRGPDGAGLWVAPGRRIGLAHRRLAIIDLTDAGIQPMATRDGALRITFNGEIYNYRELRRDLEGRGYRFHSTSDTEVLLYLYAEHGARMVERLRGMYAFGIWDEGRQELFLARDPLGIKPLYYADDGSTFRFASLAGALVAGNRVDTAEDVAGISGFYLFGCVPDPFTFYRAVRALPAGSTLCIRRGGAQPIVRYFDIAAELVEAEASPSTLGPAETAELLRETLRDSMRHHMVADVPVGIFLSSGVDSSVLATLGAELDAGRLHAITLGFREYQGTPDDETVMAERTARDLGVRHSTHWIRRTEFRDEWPRFIVAMDQASIDGLNVYLVAKAAASSRLKVAISGLGGDELFGGYPSFRQVPRIHRWSPRGAGLGRAIRAMSEPLVRLITSPKYAGVFEYGGTMAGAYLLRRALHMPWELARLIGPDRAAAALEELQPVARLQASVQGLRRPRCIVAALELTWYMRHQLLRDSDWGGMAHGVEVRVPFADATVLRTLAPLIAGPNPPGKAELADAFRGALRRELVERRKTGFTVPVRRWMRSDLPRLSRGRGLRGWARVVYRAKAGRRFLSFVTDAFGGHGGIALYNRDLLHAQCSLPAMASGVAIPRNMPNPCEPLPTKLEFVSSAVGGKMRYALAAARVLARQRGFDMVVCGHINLIPFAYVASRLLQVPLLLVIYGIDAWAPTRSRIANRLARSADRVVSISEITASKFRAWCRDGPGVVVIPNAIHAEWYGVREKRPDLLARYGLHGRKIVMTLGRLVSEERYKGFDEVLEALPALRRRDPAIAYLIVGDGSDKTRLEAKARALGLAADVVFTGMVDEAEKADHYRLADAFVMASRGEGFGFVLLEAMACGVPVVASKLDGGLEAVRGGRLGIVVDPLDAEDLERAIREALRRPRTIPPGLEHYSFANFEARVHGLLEEVLAECPRPYRSVRAATPSH